MGEFKLVPVELTEDMAAAMECQFSTEAQWEAALAAAPISPPAEVTEEAEQRERERKIAIALNDHNQLLRSAHAIALREFGADREPQTTNWIAYLNRVKECLEKHHQVTNEVRDSLPPAAQGERKPGEGWEISEQTHREIEELERSQREARANAPKIVFD